MGGEESGVLLIASTTVQQCLIVLRLLGGIAVQEVFIFTLKAKAAARRAALIFSGYSATLQLFFNWLPGWVNNEHVFPARAPHGDGEAVTCGTWPRSSEAPRSSPGQ